MKIAVLSPVAWRTPPLHYGPWEQIASYIAEGLIQQGHDVHLYATKNSNTQGTLKYIVDEAWEENKNIDAKVSECMHISYLMEHAHEYDIIHNHFDFLPLTYTRLIKTPVITTIHGFSSPKIVPVYKRFNDCNYYVSISYANRHPDLTYIGNVYHGIDIQKFTFSDTHGSYLLFFGRIHHDKGTYEAIQIALQSSYPLLISGIIQDPSYFEQKVKPYIDNKKIFYLGHSTPEQRNKLLKEALALLHPIQFNEPFGLSIIESMCCGTPVIAYNKGSIPEIISNKKTGFIVNNEQEAIETIKHIQKINRKECRQWVKEKFSIQRMIKDYLDLYEKIVSHYFRNKAAIKLSTGKVTNEEA